MRFVLLLALVLAAAFLARASEVCAPCHRAIYDKQLKSHHFAALRPIAEVPVFTQKQGLVWAFGAGSQGITPVGLFEGQYFEGRYSYFPRARQFALTFGHPRRVATASAELGILQDNRTITQCFNCHATGVKSGATSPDLSHMQPGISCERCHGPALEHIATAKRNGVMNAGRFSAKAQVQICGECHRLPPPGAASPEPEIEDPVSVRFAPIGLMASRCFTSGKLTCTTCHDPHQDASPRSDAYYTERCLTCHSNCKLGKKDNCIECHMPKAALTPYLQFTDHRIR